MTWIEGAPLGDFTGVFPLVVEEQQEISIESLALRWLRLMCEALDVLHRNGLIHGDVSPRNIIVSGSALVLTDYDFVSRIGDSIGAPGTVVYCSPSYQQKLPASPADDFYSLAASFFHIIFEKEPFRYGGDLDKTRGLNWKGIDREAFPILAEFLDRSTHSDPNHRLNSAAAAIDVLKTPQRPEPSSQPESELPNEREAALLADVIQSEGVSVAQMEHREQRVEWLHSLLQSYPGSRWGNRETRGLDTVFAAETYVETARRRNVASRHT